MTYFIDHTKTEVELHTVGALLCVLDEVASEHLSQLDTPLCSGIINMVQIVAERVTKAQDLHDAEYRKQQAYKPLETPIAAMHREIVRRHQHLNGDHGLTEEEFTAYNMATVDMANAIVDLPARNADDMLRKIMGYSINGDHTDLSTPGLAVKIWAEMQALTSRPVAA